MESTNSRRSGSVPLAAILVVIVGMIHVLSGVAAITSSASVTREVDEVLYDINVESWGWFWLAGGIAQLLTAILLFARSPIGAAIAVFGELASVVVEKPLERVAQLD